MVVELFDMLFIFYVSKMEVEGNIVIIICDIEGGVEVIVVDIFFVLSVVKGLVEQCILNMCGIMMVKCKLLNVVVLVEIQVVIFVEIYDLLFVKLVVKLVDFENMDELVCLLSEEVKVI